MEKPPLPRETLISYEGRCWAEVSSSSGGFHFHRHYPVESPTPAMGRDTLSHLLGMRTASGVSSCVMM